MIEFLKCVQLFQDLDDGELTALIEKSGDDAHQDKTFIFKEGEQGDAMYVVLDGTVKIVKMVDAGKFKTLAALGIGDFFGEMALLDGEARSASATAHGVARIMRVGRDEFAALMTENPYLGLKVVIRLSKILASRLRGANSQIIEMVAWNLQQQKQQGLA